MKQKFPLSARLLALLLLALPVGAAERKVSSVADSGETAAAWQKRLPEFWSDNLPLGEIARQLRGHFPDINFIVPSSAEGASVTVVLRSVTLGDLLKAIELASEGRIRGSVVGTETFIHSGGGLPIDSATGLPVTKVSDAVRSNLVSFTFNPNVSGQSPPNPVTSRVFSLAAYLAGRSDEDAQQAIRALYDVFQVALQMRKKFDADVQTPDFTIHQGTKLLVAAGRESELMILQQIIKELATPTYGQNPRPAGAMRPTPPSTPPADSPNPAPRNLPPTKLEAK
jgi:hypothetical protein